MQNVFLVMVSCSESLEILDEEEDDDATEEAMAGKHSKVEGRGQEKS